MKKVLIISLSPNIGHLSHVVAYYKLFEQIGYESTIYILPDSVQYLPNNLKIVSVKPNMSEYALALMYSPSKSNLFEALRIKFMSKCKLLYVYHEPLGSKKSFKDAGVSWIKIHKIFLWDKVNWLILKIADYIILPSNTALTLYESGIYPHLNKNYSCASLIFDDEFNTNYLKDRRDYFSYIGTIAADHSYNEYYRFVEWAIKCDELKGISFLIATKSNIDDNENLRRLISTGRLNVISGKPLLNEEINHFYASSKAVWNAYARSTQSGVLAKSFMFGTPVIVLKKNLSEFTEDGKNVIAIDDNTSFEEIKRAVLSINDSFESFSKSARQRFEEMYYYQKYTGQMEAILRTLS